MTVTRILAAVDDSPAGLRAAREAVDLAASLGARLRFVHVLADGEVRRRLTSSGVNGTLRRRRVSSSASLLQHVRETALRTRVVADVADREGDPAVQILAESTAWHADLLVIGRTRHHGAGRSYVGGTSQHVLEFSEVTVLLVPQPRARQGET